MAYLLVPQRAGARSVAVFVGMTSPPSAGLKLQVGPTPAEDLPSAWDEWSARGAPRFWSQRVDITGLEPARRYPVRLLDGTTQLASGEAVTLPEELPTLAEPPFVCLIGSCFAHFNDQAGAAGAAFANLPATARPHVKFLAGDQVYLDAPFPRYLYSVLGEEDLRLDLLSSYLAVWAQGGEGWGFRQLLRSGATYFCSDDHEIWNNAPSPTATVRATWWPFGDRGAAWLALAKRLYEIFQTPRRHDSFSVGRLSFMVLDIRLDRTIDRARFCSVDALHALARWVDGLPGPGVLVVGQPILTSQAGVRGHFTDWGLPDYAQYADLVRILARTQHDLLILTGDVHYGRVAGFELVGGQSLIEVIASPFALVDPRVGGKWGAPPPLFPSSAIAGMSPRSVWVEQGHQLAANQFATLEFAADGPRVQVSVRAWPIPPPGTAPTSQPVFQRTLS